MSAAQQRCFRFSLESVQKKRSWDHESGLRRLSAARLELRRLQCDSAALAEEILRVGHSVAVAWAARPDPRRHGASVSHLCEMQARLLELESSAKIQQDRVDEQVRFAKRRIQALDSLAKQCERETTGHRVNFQRLGAKESDEAWGARLRIKESLR